MTHVVLLGDSIFDNASYVPDGLAVVDQLGALLPEGWAASLLAVDGHLTSDVEGQLERLPEGATHLVVSCGGNDALSHLPVLAEPVASVAAALDRFAAIRAAFREDYRRMLEQAMAAGPDVAVCTVYDCVPDLEPMAHAALSMFNEIILREAISAGVPILDLRLICAERADYSELSSIEPSQAGGEKIATAIRDFLLDTGSGKVIRVHS